MVCDRTSTTRKIVTNTGRASSFLVFLDCKKQNREEGGGGGGLNFLKFKGEGDEFLYVLVGPVVCPDDKLHFEDFLVCN